MKKVPRTYYLSRQVVEKLEKKAEQLTLTKHGKSAVVERMIDFACDNAEDFEDYFVFDPNQKGK